MVINSQKNCSILNIDIHSFGHPGIREWFKDKLKTILQVNHVAVSVKINWLGGLILDRIEQNFAIITEPKSINS